MKKRKRSKSKKQEYRDEKEECRRFRVEYLHCQLRKKNKRKPHQTEKTNETQTVQK